MFEFSARPKEFPQLELLTIICMGQLVFPLYDRFSNFLYSSIVHPGKRDNSNGNEPRPPPRPKVHDKWRSIIRTSRSNSYDDTLDQEREDDKFIYSKLKQTDEKIDGPVSMSEAGKEGVADVDNERTE